MILGPSLTLAFLAGARRTLTIGEASLLGQAFLLVCWVAIPRIHDRWIEEHSPPAPNALSLLFGGKRASQEAPLLDHYTLMATRLRDPGYAIELVFRAGTASLLAWIGAIVIKVISPPGRLRRVLYRMLWVAVSVLVFESVADDARSVIAFTLQDNLRTALLLLWGAVMLVSLSAMGLASRVMHRYYTPHHNTPPAAPAQTSSSLVYQRLAAQSSQDGGARSPSLSHAPPPPSASFKVAKIILRKGFHILGVVIMLPGLYYAPEFLGLSLAIAVFALTALEATRLLGFSVLSGPIDRYMRPFTDTRDAGQVLTTHFSLLLGLAVPLWTSLALSPTHFAVASPSTSVSASPPSSLLLTLLYRALDRVRFTVDAVVGSIAPLSFVSRWLGEIPLVSDSAFLGPPGARGRRRDPSSHVLVFRPGLEAYSGIITLGVMDVGAYLGSWTCVYFSKSTFSPLATTPFLNSTTHLPIKQLPRWSVLFWVVPG